MRETDAWESLASGYAGAGERHARILLDSYRRLLGRPLLALRDGEAAAPLLFEAETVVLSHGTEDDPVLNYGNRAALQLWETDFADFTAMASRHTAEPHIQADRDRFMKSVAERGYAEGYKGVRISRTGRRFEMLDGVVWNLLDEEGRFYGQAAAFSRYRHI